MVLTVSFVLSPVTGLSCHRRLVDTSTKLDTSVGVSGPHDFSVRFGTVRYRRFHVHRILTRVRNDREPPLRGTRQREYTSDSGFGKSEYFLWAGQAASTMGVIDLPSLDERINVLNPKIKSAKTQKLSEVPLILQMIFHSSAVTGCTDSR
jgi:hypothetical protein